MYIQFWVLKSMLKILSGPTIKHTIGSSAKSKKSLQLCFKISYFLWLCYQISISKIYNFLLTLHTKCGNSTLIVIIFFHFSALLSTFHYLKVHFVILKCYFYDIVQYRSWQNKLISKFWDDSEVSFVSYASFTVLYCCIDHYVGHYVDIRNK